MGKEVLNLEKKKHPREASLYGHVSSWLKKQDYKNKTLISPDIPSIPTAARLGIQTIAPDVAAYKMENYSETLTLIEVKADSMYLIEGIGRCVIYKTIADYVYLALPERTASKIGSNSLYELWSIGILSVSDDGIVKEKVKAKKNTRPESEFELRSVVLKNIRSVLGIKQ